MSVSAFDLFGVVQRTLKNAGDIPADQFTARRNHLRFFNFAVFKAHEVDGTCAEIHHDDAQLFFRRRHAACGARPRLQDECFNVQSHAADALDEVRDDRFAPHRQMHVRANDASRHADRIFNKDVVVI